MVRFEFTSEGGISQNELEEIEISLRELGLDTGALKAEDSESAPSLTARENLGRYGSD